MARELNSSGWSWTEDEATKTSDGYGNDDEDAKPAISVRRIANLARFVAGLLLSGALPPTALKVVDFGGGADVSPRARLHHRLLLQALLSVRRRVGVLCSGAG